MPRFPTQWGKTAHRAPPADPHPVSLAPLPAVVPNSTPSPALPRILPAPRYQCSQWTQTRVDELLKYVELNWSAEDIAKIMGTTKNAIVGKMETLRKQKVTTLRLNGRRQT